MRLMKLDTRLYCLPFETMIIKLKLLRDNGIIIIHRHKKEEDTFPEKFNITIKKNYGIAKIIFGNILN